MIIGFRHKGLEAFYRTGTTKGIQAVHARKLSIVLAMLDAATAPQQLDLPSLRLHSLKGNLKNHWAVSISGNWRLTFAFTGVDAELVDYQDYH